MRPFTRNPISTTCIITWLAIFLTKSAAIPKLKVAISFTLTNYLICWSYYMIKGRYIGVNYCISGITSNYRCTIRFCVILIVQHLLNKENFEIKMHMRAHNFCMLKNSETCISQHIITSLMLLLISWNTNITFK